jgi:hypothetical protein
MSILSNDATITAADRKIVFTSFTDPSIPGSIRKFCLCFIKTSASERSAIEKKLKECGADLFGISGSGELALIFPGSWKISDSCDVYLKSAAVEMKCSDQSSLEAIAGRLLAYSKTLIQ